MITNKIVQTIIVVTSFIVIPVQVITTLVLGILVRLTFGLLLIPFSIIWVILFLGPLLGLSYIYERVTFLRPLIAVIGIPFAVVGNIYVTLLPSMGEMDSRYAKLVLCQTFPYTWKFNKFQNNKLNIEKNDVLIKVFKEISKAKPLGEYLDNLKYNLIK